MAVIQIGKKDNLIKPCHAVGKFCPRALGAINFKQNEGNDVATVVKISSPTGQTQRSKIMRQSGFYNDMASRPIPGNDANAVASVWCGLPPEFKIPNAPRDNYVLRMAFQLTVFSDPIFLYLRTDNFTCIWGNIASNDGTGNPGTFGYMQETLSPHSRWKLWMVKFEPSSDDPLFTSYLILVHGEYPEESNGWINSAGQFPGFPPRFKDTEYGRVLGANEGMILVLYGPDDDPEPPAIVSRSLVSPGINFPLTFVSHPSLTNPCIDL